LPARAAAATPLGRRLVSADKELVAGDGGPGPLPLVTQGTQATSPSSAASALVSPSGIVPMLSIPSTTTPTGADGVTPSAEAASVVLSPRRGVVASSAGGRSLKPPPVVLGASAAAADEAAAVAVSSGLPTTG
jgi:hypothetical protein